MTTAQSNAFRVEVVAPSGLPAWFQSATAKTWISINTKLADVDPANVPGVNPNFPGSPPWKGVEGQGAVTNDWCGGAASATSLIIAAQGGHAGYAGNEVYELDLSVAVPAWVRTVNPSTNIAIHGEDYLPDGKPASRHGYSHSQYIPNTVANGNRVFAPIGVSFYWSTAPEIGDSRSGLSYNVGTKTYDPQDFFPDYPPGTNISYQNVVAWDPATQLMWSKDAGVTGVGSLFSFNPATKTWSPPIGGFVLGGSLLSGAINPITRAFVVYDGVSILHAFDLNAPATAPVALTPTGAGPGGGAPGFVYDPVFNGFLSWNGGATVYTFKKTSGSGVGNPGWVWGTLTNAGGANPGAANANGTFSRFQYISFLHALVVVNHVTTNAFVYKLPSTAGGYT